MNALNLNKWLYSCIVFTLIYTACQQKTLISVSDVSSDALVAVEDELLRVSQGSLPDFAPDLFKEMNKEVRTLRTEQDRLGRVDGKKLGGVKKQIKKFYKNAERTRSRVDEAYELRKLAVQLNFIRAYNPKLFNRAEQNYQRLMELAKRDQFTNGKDLAQKTTEQYQWLMKDAQDRFQKETAPVLKQYLRGINADLAALNADPSSDVAQLAAVENVYRRARLGAPGLDSPIGGLFDKIYVPPSTNNNGPNAPSIVEIMERTTNTATLAWGDRSDNETGNRVLRSTDGQNYEVIADVGPIAKLQSFTYTDSNLQPATKYCYRIESYNNEGKSHSQTGCGYTLDGTDLPIWRLQLRVKVADLAGAGSDGLVGLTFGHSVSANFQVRQSIDYGHNDFERGTDFTYDLDLGENIRDLNDIPDLNMYSGENLLIEEISLLVNENEVFARRFGSTQSSVLQLNPNNFYVGYEELRSHPSWQSYVNAYESATDPGIFVIKPLIDPGQFVIKIPHEQIVSRIESIVGNTLNYSDEIRSQLRWGHIHGAPVEVSRKDAQTLSVDLDLEALVDNWPDPELDIDFDIQLSVNCNETANTISFQLKSANFEANVNSDLWLDISTLGASKLADKIINYLANNCSEAATFELDQSFEFPASAGFGCNDFEMTIDQNANIILKTN